MYFLYTMHMYPCITRQKENVRHHFGAAGGGEFKAERASHMGNADVVVLAQVHDERSADEEGSTHC